MALCHFGSRLVSLFRPEVLAERAQSHWGSVLVTQAPALRWASVCLLLGCAIGSGFVLNVDYARKIAVTGYLQPVGGIAEVAAPMAGQVAALHVREGTPVRRGQALLALDLGRLDERGVPVHVLEADHLAASIARLDELAQARDARHATEMHAARRELAHLGREMHALSEELAVVEERRALHLRAQARLERLLQRGLVAHAELERQQQQTLAVRQTSTQLKRSLAGNHAGVEARVAALDRLDRDFRIQQLRMEQERAALERQLEQTRGEHRTTVVAPRDGVAAFLQFGPGDRVMADQVLMTVAPDASAFELVLLAGAAAAGRIAIGDEVRFQVPGGRNDSGSIGAAVVREISRTPQKPYRLNSWIAVDGPVFRARAQVTEYPENLRLRHGVMVDAFVVTSSRVLWRWLLQPFSSVLDSL